MSDDRFECSYEVNDGYVGGGRPLYFTIHESDIEDDIEDMEEDDLSELFDEAMQEEFDNNIGPGEINKESFIEWAKDKIDKMNEVKNEI